jgi:hypothetical protein
MIMDDEDKAIAAFKDDATLDHTIGILLGGLNKRKRKDLISQIAKNTRDL